MKRASPAFAVSPSGERGGGRTLSGGPLSDLLSRQLGKPQTSPPQAFPSLYAVSFTQCPEAIVSGFNRVVVSVPISLHLLNSVPLRPST